MVGIVLKKMLVERAFIMMMFMYSAMKNRAKGPAAYSTLNPETNSDSPSVRSNGARFVSAKVEINHIIANGHVEKNSQVFFWVSIRLTNENEPFRSRTERKMIASVTS